MAERDVPISYTLVGSWVVGDRACGIGVREAVMIQLMGPAIGLETALGVALVMRLCSMGADALAFGVGLLFRPRRQPPADDNL